MSATDTGHKAERAAATYLEMRGFTIMEQNWRRPRAEIDIVAQKDGVVHFVEVKYRRNDDYGSGFEAITAAKLKQMQRAAYLWIDETKWLREYTLSAIEVGGPNFTIMSFVENAY